MPSLPNTRRRPTRSDAPPPYHARRDFLWSFGGGLGGVALASLLHNDGLLAASAPAGWRRSVVVHHPPRAARVVQLFMSGAASQCDLFDYKPALEQQHGLKFDPGEAVELFQSSPDKVMRSPFAWRRHGQCGKWLSEPVAPLGACVDDIAFIHSMASKSNVHGPATFMQATGFILPGFPGAGAWVSYGLGSMNDDLPAFVVLPDPRGFAPNGPKNWASGFLPAEHQGTMIQPNSSRPIADLFPPDGYVTPGGERDAVAVLAELNRRHALAREGDSRLEARIRSYELAARMQLSAPAVLDLRREPEHILRMYGLDRDNTITAPTGEINTAQEIEYFGRNCLTARRLLEQGVRFVQVWSGADNGFPRRNWDSHEDVQRDHGPLGRALGVGAAALIIDLKQRGMLDDTIVLWTTEFGRMPCNQGAAGRDHNPFVFTNWLAGGGVKGGVTYGESDEWSYKPLDRSQPTYCYDVHATLLHLLGIDHERLTYRHDGIDRRLTDVHGRVLREILA
ncbi:MAG: DUF1501 domain-containing protein [Planctomycetota bacterium]|nr:MAG: DUF1501 domain-containing protein [Planctomycetota bacterium]